MALLGIIALSPIVASATTPPSFTLGGTAFRAGDPTAPSNFVVSMDTSAPGSFGFATRTLNVPITSLTGFLSFDYYLAGRDCGGGSPRIQLGVDLNGDGIRDGNAFGYAGPLPSFVGCSMNAWQHADLTDSGGRWDLSQLGLSGYIGWPEVLTFFSGFPLSNVQRGSLVDDSAWMSSAAGLAYYDNVVIGDQVLASAGDVVSSEAPVHLDVGSDHVVDSDYGTIQAGVNAAASSGDTVLVDPGTYPELVVVTKSVTLLGAQAGNPGFGSRVGDESIVGTSDGAFQILANNVVIDGFTISGVDGNSGVSSLGAGIWTTGTTSGHGIRNNILTGNTIGLYLNSDGTFPSVVEGNLFDSNNAPGGGSGDAIYSDQGANRITIQDNRFTGQDSAAMVFAGGFPPATATQSDIAVADNVFVNDAGGAVFFFTTGLQITGNSWTNSAGTSVFLGGGVHDVAITGNTFQTAAFRGIRVLAGLYGDTELDTNVVAQFNDFIANAAEGLRVDTASYSGTFDATCNWWGDPSGPVIASNPGGTGDEIFDAGGVVHFVPWLSSSIPNPCGAGPVHLDIGSNGVVDVSFGTIGPAVSSAHNGDTISVDAGTYPELVVVDKSLTFRGAESGVDACGGRAGPESIVGSSEGAFLLFADHITLDGFTVAGVTGGYTAGIYASGGFSGYDIRNDIVRDNVFGLYFNSNGAFASRAEFNLFENNNNPGAASGNGIYSDQGAHDVGVTGNCFVGNANTAMLFVGGAGGTSTSQSDLSITANRADNSIALVATDRGLIADNVLTLDPAIAGTGIFLGGGVTNVVITGNTVENSPYSGIRATVDPANFGISAPNTDLTVATNVLHGNAFGVNLFGVQNVVVEGNTITGSQTSVKVIESTGVAVQTNDIMNPDAHGLTDVIGVEVVSSDPVLVRANTIDFNGFAGGVSTLSGVSYRDSSGGILGNLILDVRMAAASFGVQTGLGIVATGTSAVDITGNTVERYQKGGIVVGSIGDGLGNDHVTATIDDNSVVGVGPTDLIAQNGIEVADASVAEVGGNHVIGNWYSPCGDYLTCYNAAGILLVDTAGTIVADNVLTDNQAGVNLYLADSAQISRNKISGSAWAVIVDSSDDAGVLGNTIGAPTVASGAVQVIGIWALDSLRVEVANNAIDFGGAVAPVGSLQGIRFQDSAGRITTNVVRNVRMAGADFGPLTGIGIVATGHGDLWIEQNDVGNYQWGGIFVGLPESPYTGRVDIVDNHVRGVGPTHMIRQIGILLSGAGVTGSVTGNLIADNCFIGGGRTGNGHDADVEHGTHDHETKDRDDDHDGKTQCRGDFDVKEKDKKTCPPGVAVGLLLCNILKDAVDISKNTFSGNQVDILRVHT